MKTSVCSKKYNVKMAENFKPDYEHFLEVSKTLINAIPIKPRKGGVGYDIELNLSLDYDRGCFTLHSIYSEEK